MKEELRASLPWWVMESISYLHDNCLENPDGPLTFKAYEWGSGGSTVWFSQRVASCITLEHNEEWYKSTKGELDKYDITNVELVYLPLDQGYANHILQYPDESFDIISVDGRERANCIRNAVSKLKSRGIFVLDNSERSQYRDAMQLMDTWERHDFFSGYSDGTWWTTVWRKP